MRVLFPLLLAGAVLAQDADKPYLGISLRELTPEKAKELGVEATEGLVVISTGMGSPARVAGVMPLDLLLSINGQETRDKASYQAAMAPLAIGATAVLKLSRKGEVLERTAVLVSKKAYDEEWLLVNHPMPEFVVDEWIGAGPASEKDLRGAVVVLDFWTMT